jgi:hypothetical protein
VSIAALLGSCRTPLQRLWTNQILDGKPVDPEAFITLLRVVHVKICTAHDEIKTSTAPGTFCCDPA